MIFTSILLAICVISAHASVTGYISTNDEERLLIGITAALVKPAQDDVISAYYGIKGFKLLNRPLVQVLKLDNCYHLEVNFKKDSGPEAAFHALSAYALLECKDKILSDATVASVKAALENEKSSTLEIRYALETLQFLGQQIPNPAKVAQLIQARLKEDDSLQSLGHALHAASLLGQHGKFMLDRVEDIVVQADEVDGKLLQWEGGLTTTGLLLTGLYKLPGAKPLSQTQVDKFANYLLTRRSVQSAKGAIALIESAIALSNSNLPPVSITIAGPHYISQSKPELTVRITDLLGRVLKSPPTPVVAQSATRVADDVVVLSKQPLKQGSNPTEFVLPLNVDPGQYRIGLTAGSHSTSLTIKMLGPVNLQSIEIGVGDADGAAAPRYTKLAYPNKLSQSLQADSTQHLFIRFNLPRPVHQAFLRLSSGKKEIVFVAEKDNNQLYKIEVNLASELVNTGVFDMELIVGDSIMSNPLRWSLGSLDAKLGSQEGDKTVTRGPKPEIEHLFRPAEKRPAQIVSLLFTALAASPLLLLLILWLKIGININNFSFAAIPFHAGFASILGLFTMFWLKLDMFTTCAWLIPLGAFTFLAGNKLLRKIAKQKKH